MKEMTHMLALITSVSLICGCSMLQPSGPTRTDLISVSLEDVSLLDALRMSHRGPVSNFGFTKDSLSPDELEDIRVTVSMDDVTVTQYLQELARQSGLTVEEVFFNYFRVVHRNR